MLPSIMITVFIVSGEATFLIEGEVGWGLGAESNQSKKERMS